MSANPRKKRPFVVRHALIDPAKITRRLVRNPAYNNDHVSLNGWCLLPLRDQSKPALQDALEQSVLREGFRNPIIVYALEEGIFLSFGGTRLRAAHKLGLKEIPCIVNDYTGKFKRESEVTPENVLTFFTDAPPWYEFGEHGFDQHYFLERMRRDNATGAGLEWLKNQNTDFIHREMPWAVDLLPQARNPKRK